MNTKELALATKELTKLEKKLDKQTLARDARIEKAVNKAREKAESGSTKKIETLTTQIQSAKEKLKMLIQ
jgi:hypothetical protein